MPAQVVGHEGGDEVVAVVVAGLEPQRQRLARDGADGLQPLGAELGGQEGVGLALVDQEVRRPRAVLDQGDRIVAARFGPR